MTPEQIIDALLWLVILVYAGLGFWVVRTLWKVTTTLAATVPAVERLRKEHDELNHECQSEKTKVTKTAVRLDELTQRMSRCKATDQP